MWKTARVRLLSRLRILLAGGFACVALSAPEAYCQKICFTGQVTQVGCSHIVTDSLCLRPRSLARETGRAGYWSRIVYEETIEAMAGERGARFRLTFLEEEEFSPFMMYDDDKADSLPLHRALTIDRTANGIHVEAVADTGPPLGESVRERIARMYASSTAHEICGALLENRCVTVGDSAVVEVGLMQRLFGQDGVESLIGPAILHVVRAFDTLDVSAVELLLVYTGRTGASGDFEERTEHRITLVVTAPEADPLRITEYRARSLHDTTRGGAPRDVTVVLRCLRFSAAHREDGD